MSHILWEDELDGYPIEGYRYFPDGRPTCRAVVVNGRFGRPNGGGVLEFASALLHLNRSTLTSYDALLDRVLECNQRWLKSPLKRVVVAEEVRRAWDDRNTYVPSETRKLWVDPSLTVERISDIVRSFRKTNARASSSKKELRNRKAVRECLKSVPQGLGVRKTVAILVEKTGICERAVYSHLKAIRESMEEQNRRTRNVGTEWSLEHDRHLQMRSERDTVDVMAEDLGRSVGEVEARCSTLLLAYRRTDGSTVAPDVPVIDAGVEADFLSSL